MLRLHVDCYVNYCVDDCETRENYCENRRIPLNGFHNVLFNKVYCSNSLYE